MSEFELNDRAQTLLKALVERYIHDGQPVGSRTLARDVELDVSPATVRNVMCDLEEMGLITSPHTSAGRVPTAKGYRFFVDTLLTVRPLDSFEVESLQAHIRSDCSVDPQRLVTSASSLLSEITTLAGVVMLPRREQIALRQLEFLPLANRRVLAILVFNEQEVQNRVIETSREYSSTELRQATNYLNQAFAGKDLKAVRAKLLKEMRQAQQDMSQLMSTAMEIAEKAFEQTEQQGDYILAGQTNLMTYAEMSDVDRLRRLFEVFNQKRDILHLLDQSLRAQGIQIFIGNELGNEVLGGCSVVTSPYEIEGEVVGVLGVIGPTRMRYDRVIPIVDVTARLLGAALNQAH